MSKELLAKWEGYRSGGGTQVGAVPKLGGDPSGGGTQMGAVRLRPSFLAAAPQSVRSDDAMITGCATRSAATSLQLLAVQTRNKPVIHTIVHVADVVVFFISGLQFVTTLERRSEQQHQLLRCDSRNAILPFFPELGAVTTTRGVPGGNHERRFTRG